MALPYLYHHRYLYLKGGNNDLLHTDFAKSDYQTPRFMRLYGCINHNFYHIMNVWRPYHSKSNYMAKLFDCISSIVLYSAEKAISKKTLSKITMDIYKMHHHVQGWKLHYFGITFIYFIYINALWVLPIHSSFWKQRGYIMSKKAFFIIRRKVFI